MKIMIDKLIGDATVLIYNKHGEIIHTEGFYGKTETQFIRNIPVSEVEYSDSRALCSDKIEYRIVV